MVLHDLVGDLCMFGLGGRAVIFLKLRALNPQADMSPKTPHLREVTDGGDRSRTPETCLKVADLIGFSSAITACEPFAS